MRILAVIGCVSILMWIAAIYIAYRGATHAF